MDWELFKVNFDNKWWLSDNKTGRSNRRRESPSDLNSQVNTLERQRAERDAQILAQTERLHAAEQARTKSVRMRLGLSVREEPLPLPHPPAGPRKRPDSSVRGGRIRSDKYLPSLNAGVVTEDQTFRTQWSLEGEEEEDLNSGSTPVVVSNSRRPQTPYPRHPPSDDEEPKRGVRRLPVFKGYSSRSVKVVAGYILQTAKDELENVLKGVEDLLQNNAVYVPQTPEVPRQEAVFTPTPPPTPRTKDVGTLTDSPPKPRRNAAGRPFNPAPPPKPAPAPPKAAKPKNRGVRVKVSQQPAEKVNRTSSLRTAEYQRNLQEREPLLDPVEGLSLSLKLLSSEDWEKKMDGLQKIQALAQHDQDTLKVKLHEVCIAVSAEVQNLRSSVAVAAMETMAYLYVYMQKAMDCQAERTGLALLQKIAQSNANPFIQRQANMALEAMVENCSPNRVLITLVNSGLSHRSAAVRAGTAQQFHLLADIMGVDEIFDAGKSFTQSFLTAVSKMSLDASAEVRPHGHAILQELTLHRDFTKLWNRIITDKDRGLLERVLRTARKA